MAFLDTQLRIKIEVLQSRFVPISCVAILRASNRESTFSIKFYACNAHCRMKWACELENHLFLQCSLIEKIKVYS